jgi:hypothetical protein
LLVHTLLEFTDTFRFHFLGCYETQNSLALLVWCNGSITTFTKLPVRVRFPSPTPQPQNLLTDLLVVIKESKTLSKSLEATRGSFNLCAQRPGQRELCITCLKRSGLANNSHPFFSLQLHSALQVQPDWPKEQLCQHCHTVAKLRQYPNQQ